MSNYRQWLCGVVTVASVVAAQDVAAQSGGASYYLGIEAGHEWVSFEPQYRYVDGSPSDTFHNQANGSVFGVVGGYHWQSTKDFSLDVQGRLSVSNADWTATLPEPASLRYDLPVNVAVSLLPAFRISEKFSVFAEAGLALGKIRERKTTTNASSSSYDSSKWQPGIVAGFGVRFALDERWSVRAGYRRTWYQDHDFSTYRADGRKVETVTSQVVQNMTTIGLFRTF